MTYKVQLFEGYFSTHSSYDQPVPVSEEHGTEFDNYQAAQGVVDKLRSYGVYGKVIQEVQIKTVPVTVDDVVDPELSDDEGMVAVDSDEPSELDVDELDDLDSDEELDTEWTEIEEVEDEEQSISPLELKMMGLSKAFGLKEAKLPAKPEDDIKPTEPKHSPNVHYKPLATYTDDLNHMFSDIDAMTLVDPKVPTELVKLMISTVKRLETEATHDKIEGSGINTKLTAADAIRSTLELIDSGEAEDFKRAQLLIAGLQTPVLHNIPQEIYSFFLAGRKTRSLQDVYKEVGRKK